MEKKKYLPMTVCHEEFQMNQAIAGGCTYKLAGSGLICDNCWPEGGHTWTVYENGSYGIGVSETELADQWSIYGDCADLPVHYGDAFIASDEGRDGTWDPNGQLIGGGSFKRVDLGSTSIDSSGNLIYNSNS